MKLWIQHMTKKFPLLVESSDSLEDFKAMVGSCMDASPSDFELSLDNQNPIYNGETPQAVSLGELGLVNGDKLYVLSLVAILGFPDSAEQESALEAKPVVVPASGVLVSPGGSDVEMAGPSGAAKASVGEQNDIVISISVSFAQRFVATLIQRKATYAGDVVACLCHQLLASRGFYVEGAASRGDLPADWKKAAPLYYSVAYRHPASDVRLQLTLSQIANEGQTQTFQVIGCCKKGDSVFTQNTNVSSDSIRVPVLSELNSKETNFDAAQFFTALLEEGCVENIKAQLLDAISLRALGHIDCPLLRLPDDVLLHVLKKLSIRTLLNLAAASRLLKEQIDVNQALWTDLLKKQFGDAKVNSATDGDFKRQYIVCYSEAKAAESKGRRRRAIRFKPPPEFPFWLPHFPGRNPDGGDRNPIPPYFPGIGGPDDLFPRPHTDAKRRHADDSLPPVARASILVIHCSDPTNRQEIQLNEANKLPHAALQIAFPKAVGLRCRDPERGRVMYKDSDDAIELNNTASGGPYFAVFPPEDYDRQLATSVCSFMGEMFDAVDSSSSAASSVSSASSTKSFGSNDQSTFKKQLLDRYWIVVTFSSIEGYLPPHEQIRCMLLDIPIARELVLASHIMPKRFGSSSKFLLNFAEINNPANGLLLFKAIEYAFDRRMLCFVVDPVTKNYVCKILNPHIKSTNLFSFALDKCGFDESNLNHEPTRKLLQYRSQLSAKTFGDLENLPLKFTPGCPNRPMKRCLYMAARYYRHKAIKANWISPEEFDVPDFVSDEVRGSVNNLLDTLK